MLCLLLLAALPAFGVTLPGDPGDGTIHFETGGVDTAGAELTLGHRGDGTELVTAIYLFELPDLAGSADVHSAALQFTFLDRSGSFATNPANADVWGLGYVSSPTISTNWHLLGDSDTRTGNDLGTGIGTNPVVRLSDNFLSSDSNEPVGEAYRMALPSPKLAAFIGLLYDQGATAGDYAVIRVNVDAPTSDGNRGFDLASADAADEATRPVLSINEGQVLMYDPFDDGDRTNGDDPLDTDWYKISSSLNLTVEDDSANIGSGNALSVVMDNTGRRFLCSFPRVTLANPGDFIQMSCTIRPVFTLGATEAFRMGLLDSGGVPLAGDTTSSSDAANYQGYLIRMSTEGGGNGDLSLVGVPTGSFLGGSTDFLSREEGVLNINASTIYQLIYTITRTSSTQLTTRAEINDIVINGMDPGTDVRPESVDFYDSFDTLGMGAGNSSEAVDFFLDNVLVETSVSLVDVVPHQEVMINAMELQVATQPNLRYALQSATDLVSSNWTDTGYTLTGDGSDLSVYDPDPVEPSKVYRMESRP